MHLRVHGSHYFSQFQATGHVQGDGWCRGAYVMSIALYKPIQLPMLQCVIKLLTVRLAGNEGKAKKKQIRTAFSLFGGLSTEVLASWELGTLIWLISFWYMIPAVMVLPLTVIFAPATLPLLFFMLAPCMAMYIAAAVSGSLNRFLRIRELPQHGQLSKEQQVALRQCTQAEFQKDAMPCISFMRGTEVVQMPKRKQSTSEVSKKVHPRTSSEDGESLSECAAPHQSFELLQYEEPDPQQRWQQVYQLNSVTQSVLFWRPSNCRC